MESEALDLSATAPTRGLVSRIFAWLRTRTFRSLRHRDYRLYFLGQIVSFTGSWMQSAALMWLVYSITQDPLWPPLMLVAQVGPTILLGTYGGAIADRVPKRRLIFTTQLGFLLTTLGFLFVTLTGFASPFVILGLQIMNGIIQSADLPARLSFVPELVPREDLMNAVSLNAMLFNAARAVGPGLTGLAFLLSDAVVAAGYFTERGPTILGAIGCFVFNAITYLVVLVALTRITCPGAVKPKAEGDSKWDGFRLAWASPQLGGLLVVSGLLCVFAWPTLTMFPAYTKTVLLRSEKEYSLLVSALGFGALLAALTAASFGTPQRRGRFLLLGLVCTWVGILGLFLTTAMLPALAVTAILGFGLIIYLATGQSTLQLEASDESRGRMMALWAMMLSASAPIGHLCAGIAAQHYPVPDVLLVLLAGVSLGGLALVRLVLRHF
ncbi:MAG: MFS transporter [Fimbriiglobus sp.]